MTSQGRRILFIWAVTLFILLSTLVLIFAFGFRYDFKNNLLTKTGSIVLKPNVEAQILINDKPEGHTSFLNNTFSKKRLLPGNYTVKVQKDKYFSWQKEIEVKEGLVSDFSRIVLFKQNQIEQVSVNGKSPMFIDREGKRVIYWGKDTISFYELGGNQPIYQSEATLDFATLKVVWGTEGKEALVYDKSKVFYFDLSKKTFKPMGSSKQYVLESSVLKNGSLYFLKARDLLVLSVENLKSQVVSKNLISFLIYKNEIFALSSGESKLIKIDLNGENEQNLGNFPARNSRSAGTIKKIEYQDGTHYLLIDSHLYSLKSSEVTLIADDVQRFAISPDNTMLGWHNGHEFWIEWIKDTEYQPLKKTEERELIAEISKNIREFSWYKNSSHVFLELEDGLAIVETDLRGGANMYLILVLNNQEYAWYDLSQNKIFKSSVLNGLVSVDAP